MQAVKVRLLGLIDEVSRVENGMIAFHDDVDASVGEQLGRELRASELEAERKLASGGTF